MDVNKLFKLPSLPSAAVNKRKWNAPEPKDPSSSGASTSTSTSETVASDSTLDRPSKAARVDDDEDDDNNGSDGQPRTTHTSSRMTTKKMADSLVEA